ncbi:hypothetical protein [Amycolatopsis eburnea]|uniref:Uncharacterized protein n=1 Tax=Amycolatopsis eburnea TaxID=2267691 RepID=A0A427TPT1_9PSEU|nr:hypothetical protein [Amycolatopsis eburnea]RSD26363.1 hypothetical protein EIY87_00430 [Amycolatopsis eburnea]
MPRFDQTTAKIEFSEPATVAELIEALEDLRAKAGPDATPRVAGFLEFDLNGPRVRAISVDLPTARERTR